MDQTALLQEENRRLRKAVEELSILNELARVISSTMSLDQVIESVVKRSVKAVDGRQGLITLVDESSPTEMKTLIRSIDTTGDQQEFRLNQNILGWMLINKKPLLSNDISSDARFSGIHATGEIRSILCVPLLVRNRLIGILAVFNKKENGSFTEDDKRLLAIIATQSAQILENARLYDQEKSLHVVQEQIRLASIIQLDLLPKHLPQIPGYEITGRTIPAQMVGGDYFDFIPTEESGLALCLGDVSGKGLPASLLMANLQATLRGQTLINSSAKDCISRSNKLLHESTSSEKFATLFFGILDYRNHRLRYCNAGQDPPFLVSSKGSMRRLTTGGIVLSILSAYPFEEEVVDLEPGDTLLIYSDGIPEAMNADREFFGEERLTAFLNANAAVHAGELMDALVAEVKKYAGTQAQSDDMTLVVVKRLAE
jgi:phosphoserine phosphatase RsbU/P